MKVVVWATLALMALVPVAWGQRQEEIGPVNLTGNLGVGYSSVQSSQTINVSDSSPIMSGDADFLGYWKDPRILLFDVAPFVTLGHSVTNSSDLVNRGKGFTATTTVMGGSPFPVTITYSRLWQDFPSIATTNNLLGSIATSSETSNLGIDWGVYWKKLPPLSFHYGTGSSETDFPAIVGSSSQIHTNIFSVNSSYHLLGWRLEGGYSRNHLDGTRADLLNLGGLPVPEIADSSDLHASAQRSLPLHSNLTVVGGQRHWSDNTVITDSDSTYEYARALATSHPFKRLNLNFNSGYTSNDTAAVIQQALGQTPTPVSLPILTTQTVANGRSLDVGGGALFFLPRGFSINSDGDVGTITSSFSPNGTISSWDAGLNYLHTLGRTGSLTASYGYQHAETDVVIVSSTSTTQTLRAGASKMVPSQIQLSGGVHYDQSEFANVVAPSPSVTSPGHGYGVTFNAVRALTAGWRMSGDFELDHHLTEFPLNVKVDNKSFGIRADSSAWELLVRRTYHEGLALQVGNGIVFVNNPVTAVQTPLATVLSLASNVQTMFVGSYRPGRKRLSVNASLTRFSYDSKGVQVTDATLLNTFVSYRLRRLQLRGGCLQSDSKVFVLNPLPYNRREIYFEVVRHFRVF